MFILPKRHRILYPLLLLLALVVACGEGDICESDDARRSREFREREMFLAMQRAMATPTPAPAIATPQVSAALQVTRIESTLAIPVTTYTVTASAPAGTQITYEWSMSGETCGTPVSPWKQSGATVTWSHSDQKPDNCAHRNPNHAVTATVVVRGAGAALECTIEGTENRKVENPPCKKV